MEQIVEATSLREKTPYLSVGLITYNQEKYIASCIESILMQEVTFDYEIIIGDDGSRDKTREICLKYQAQYPDKIKLVLADSNRGLMKNYLAVSRQIRGELFAQLAGDDYWTDPCKLQKQVSFLQQNPDYGMVYTDFDFFLKDGTYIRNAFESKHRPRSIDFEDQLLHKRFMAPLTWVVRSTYKPSNMGYEGKNYVDESFAHLLDLMKDSKVHYLPESTAVKRVLKGSLSNPESHDKIYYFQKGLFAMQKEYAEKFGVSEALKTQIYTDNYFLLGVAAHVFKDQALVDEAKAFMESKHMDPKHWADHMNSLAVYYSKLYKLRHLIQPALQVKSYIAKLTKRSTHG